MKTKNRMYLGALLIIGMLAACKTNDEITEVITPPEAPLFSSGQIVTSDLEKDGVVIESMIDTVVNLGSNEAPALFYLNGKHTISGVEVENGNQASNAFRSITRQDLNAFIKIWGNAYNIPIDINDNSLSAVKNRHLAYFILQDFLRQNDCDLPLLIALSNNVSNLKSSISIIEGCKPSATTPGIINTPNTADNVLRAIEASGIQTSELTMAIKNKGLSEKDFMDMVAQKGINFPATLKSAQSTSGEVAEIVEAVFEGLVKLNKILVKFIENGAPSVDIEDAYVSYLHQDDTNPLNYISSQTATSPTYSVKYCTLATASFYLETEYNAVHKTLPGHFITRSGMIVKSVRCSGGMHVNGSTNFEIPVTTGSNENPIASTKGTVTVKYGDCCCFARTANLSFTISGDKGYTENSWKSNTK